MRYSAFPISMNGRIGAPAASDSHTDCTTSAVGRFITHLRERELLDQILLIIHADHGQNLLHHVVSSPRAVGGERGARRQLEQAVKDHPPVARHHDAQPPGTLRWSKR